MDNHRVASCRETETLRSWFYRRINKREKKKKKKKAWKKISIVGDEDLLRNSCTNWKTVSRGCPKIRREVTRFDRLHLSVRPGREASRSDRWTHCQQKEETIENTHTSAFWSHGFEITRAAENRSVSREHGVGQAALLLWHGPSTCRASPTVEIAVFDGEKRAPAPTQSNAIMWVRRD